MCSEAGVGTERVPSGPAGNPFPKRTEPLSNNLQATASPSWVQLRAATAPRTALPGR